VTELNERSVAEMNTKPDFHISHRGLRKTAQQL